MAVVNMVLPKLHRWEYLLYVTLFAWERVGNYSFPREEEAV